MNIRASEGINQSHLAVSGNQGAEETVLSDPKATREQYATEPSADVVRHSIKEEDVDAVQWESDSSDKTPPSPAASNAPRTRRSPRKAAARTLRKQRKKTRSSAADQLPDRQFSRPVEKPAELPWLLEHLLIRPLEVLVLLTWRFARLLATPVLDASKFVIYGLLALVLSVWLVQQPAYFFKNLIKNPLNLLRPSLIIDIPRTAYCSTIRWGCSRTYSKEQEVAFLARTTAAHAHQAHDIFQSVVRLGDPTSLGLHHAQIWELSVAVRASSKLETKEELGVKLRDLGNLSRDVKDSVISINAKGINAFSWTVEAFRRIEVMIEHMQKSGSYTSETISKQLDRLYERLNMNLDDMLALIERAIPEAERGASLGTDILHDFSIEQARLRRSKEETPLWRLLLDQTSWKGKQLSRDLELTTSSIRQLQVLSRNLDAARSFLVGYRDNTAQFAAGMTGLHLSDNLMLPEHEVESLRGIMGRFTASVHAVKTGKTGVYEASAAGKPVGIEGRAASLWDVD